MSLADIDKRGLVLRTAIAPPVWRGAPWLTRLLCHVRNPLCIYCARYLGRKHAGLKAPHAHIH